MSSPLTEFYVTGGTLRRDATCYVVRQADHELHAGLKRGKFCYVLTPRQMGKSSLMVRAAARLREEGCGVVNLDLTAIGQNLSADQWYRGLLSQMGDQLELEDELIESWRDNKELGAMQRWMRAIREIVLPRYPGPVVIFIDEIDYVRSLPFSTDEFFAAIREFYNRRTENEEFERLTFCLLGVASPSDLIRDTRTTPFNIGRRIELNDFTKDETASLAQGLNCKEKDALALLKRIHYWTNGHPYLTQRLCQSVVETNPQSAIRNPQSIDRLCEEMFFTARAQERDDNLLFVRERMLRSDVDLAGLLHLYGQVRSRKRVRDDETNPFVGALRLSGIARVENGRVRERNRIYARVFDREWIKTNMPDAEAQRQRAAFRRGVWRATAVAVVIIAMMAVLAYFAIQQRNRAIEQERDNRWLLYSANLNLAQQTWEAADLQRMGELLTNQIPRPGQEDLRGFEWYHLWHLCCGSAFARHAAGVTSLEYSPDGAKLATGSFDGTAKLLEADTGQELATLKGHTAGISMVAYSPDGARLATASYDGTAKLWEAVSGKEALTLKGHKQLVTSLAYSPDGKRLATGSLDNTIKLWDAATGQEMATFNGHADRVTTVAFSPDGAKLASGSHDQTVKLWDATNGHELAQFTYPREVQCLSFSPNGTKLAVGARDGVLRLVELATGKEVLVFKGHAGHVLAVRFLSDGARLATGSGDRTAKLWDVITGRELVTFRKHVDKVWAVAFSPDGTKLATGSEDYTVRLWGVATGQELKAGKTILNGVWSVAFSPDSSKLATGSKDHTVTLWEVATGRQLAILRGHEGEIGSVAFSPDGAKLSTVSSDLTVKIWEVATGKELVTLKGQGRVFAVAFSPDGKILATGSNDHTVKLREVATWQELATLKGHTDTVWTVAFSPDGTKLASGSSDRDVKLWDVVAGRELATLKGHSNIVNTVAFSPDGARLATGSYDRTTKIWDVGARKELTTLRGHAGGVVAVKYSPDGARLATGGDDMIKLWEVTRGVELLSLKGQKGVWSVAFSPDGAWLASGSADGMVRLWRAASGKEVWDRRK
ncbi:MAG TPA: AAA-like domain-containing protein [Blastocatellia bacterium]|nr:AAA-like domain-containing protein [Blastocatellia bacterium]